MSITSSTKKPWKSWAGLIFLVGIAAVFVYPIFSRSGEQFASVDAVMPEMAGLPMEKKSAMRAATKVAPTSPSVSGVAWAASMNRMVVYTAEVSIETREIEKQHREITRIARAAGGFVTSSGITSYDGGRAAQVTVRVPQKSYVSTLDAICRLGKLLSRNEKGEDVTEEYVDLQARLRNLKREEEAFLKVLGRASRIADILAVERELSRVRGEIETAEGRIKYLDNQVQLSTITVSLSEPQPVVSATNIVKWDVWNTGKSAANTLSGVFRGITSAVIWLVVFIPLWAVLGIVAYGARRRFLRRAG